MLNYLLFYLFICYVFAPTKQYVFNHHKKQLTIVVPSDWYLVENNDIKMIIKEFLNKASLNEYFIVFEKQNRWWFLKTNLGYLLYEADSLRNLIIYSSYTIYYYTFWTDKCIIFDENKHFSVVSVLDQSYFKKALIQFFNRCLLLCS